MNRVLTYLTIIIATTLSGCCYVNKPVQYKAEKLCGMPSIEQGYEQGVSACYAAATSEALFIAGGCNFPDTPAAEGGKKVYYKGIYRTSTDNAGDWEMVGELPESSAYGANIQQGENWYIVGGMNSNGATEKAYRITLDDRPAIEMLPPLPCAIDNLSGTVMGNTLCVAGGNADGKASNRVFILELNEGKSWIELPPMPGAPRVQPVCSATDGYIYIWGGFTPATQSHEAIVHCNGIRYGVSNGIWEELGETSGGNGTLTLSGGAAIAINDSTIIAAGGVNKDIFLDAISGRYELVDKEDYMHKPVEWYKFNRELLMYNTHDNSWRTIGNDTVYARAGAQLIRDGNTLYQIGGELKPGIRTPGIYKISRE